MNRQLRKIQILGTRNVKEVPNVLLTTAKVKILNRKSWKEMTRKVQNKKMTKKNFKKGSRRVELRKPCLQFLEGGEPLLPECQLLLTLLQLDLYTDSHSLGPSGIRGKLGRELEQNF
jgi:hypothetical protein